MVSKEIAMAAHNEFGKKGEDMAVDFLSDHGYTILERNYRFGKAELDIIALKDTVLAIVEVKSRNSDAIINPAEAITPKKIQLLCTAANEYVITNDLDIEVRFDYITIVKKSIGYRITHTKQAFYHF